jgi:thiamine biosynthesis lipoprotein
MSDDGISHKTAIDSLLKEIDSSMSTYLPISFISRINNNDSSVLVDQYFIDVFNKSIEVSEKTDGLFDVTVAPLVNSWGFGYTKKATLDNNKIDSLLQLVGYKFVKLEGNKIIKAKPEVKLDFNAIAQGYSVDVLANYLESKGIENYLVELGGELKAKGKKEQENWKVGIDKPGEKASTERKLEAVINLNNKALATSGNYRKFYEENGQKFSHIINPKTGYPAKQNLLSATVIADDGITADAYATAFMVMGLNKSIQFLEDNKHLQLEVYFIYDDHGTWKTYTSESLKKWITELH